MFDQRRHSREACPSRMRVATLRISRAVSMGLRPAKPYENALACFHGNDHAKPFIFCWACNFYSAFSRLRPVWWRRRKTANLGKRVCVTPCGLFRDGHIVKGAMYAPPGLILAAKARGEKIKMLKYRQTNRGCD